MIRVLAVATIAPLVFGCGRSQGIDDHDLGGLVYATKPNADPIDLGKAAKDPAELGRALAVPEHAIATALGPHATTIATLTSVEEGGKQVEDLSDHTTIELGDKGAFHAVYTNSADYGREAMFVAGKLYLRPRYQRWHARDPEGPDEADKLEDSFADAILATWDLLSPGIELTDQGPAEVAGRSGRKIAVKLSPNKQRPPAEPIAQRKWRETRTVDALAGEVVLDADKGVPLSVRLGGIVSFSRDGRRFQMKVQVDSTVGGIGVAAPIAAPTGDDVVATPERMREVDDRDSLLQGIAPPQHGKKP